MKRHREHYYAMRIKRRQKKRKRVSTKIQVLIAIGAVLLLFILFCVLGNFLKSFVSDYKEEAAAHTTADSYITAAPEKSENS